MEVRIMRAESIPAEQQYRLIMECRSSGLTDYQWCMEHDIKPGTFYNWVRRLRKRGCTDIPVSARHRSPAKQEIVRIAFDGPVEDETTEPTISSGSIVWDVPQSVATEAVAMELTIAGDILRIPNGTDASLLEHTIRLLKGLSC
jgi:transposase-like protein